MNMALSYPAVNGEVVTQAHADYCAAHGHAAHTVDGTDTGICPRCGEPTRPLGPVVDVLVKDLQVGMVLAHQSGRASAIYKLERPSPRARSYDVSTRKTTPRPDGWHNTVTQTYSWTSTVKVMADSINNPVDVPTPEQLEQMQQAHYRKMGAL